MEELREMSLFADGVRIAEDSRMRIRGRATMSLRPDLWELNIFSPPSDALAAIHDAKQLMVEGEEMSTIACGQIEEIYTHQEGDKNITTVILSDGMDFWSSTVSVALAKGNTVYETIRTLVAKCTAPAPIVSLQASDAYFFRGQTFHGKTVNYISDLAKSIQARAFFVRGGLHFAVKGAGTEKIVLRESDLMNDISEANGAYVVQLAGMKGYPIGQIVEFRELTASRFRLLCQSIEADNYEGPWKSELIMVDESKVKSGDDWGGGL